MASRMMGATRQHGTTERATFREYLPSILDGARSFPGNNESWNRQYVLALDGGGVRGYSALLILKELMSKIEALERNHEDSAASSLHPQQSAEIPNGHPNASDSEASTGSSFYPCHYFDYAFGTSTGGLVAIMLGRLRMSVDDALGAYEELAGYVFGNPRLASIRGPIPWPCGKYDSERFKMAINRVCKSQAAKRAAGRWHPTGSPRPGYEPFLSDPVMCRTVCLAYANVADHDAQEEPFLFRSYDHTPTGVYLERNPGNAHTYPIYQVALATCSAPTYFDSMMMIGDSKFWDGGFGCNNPSSEAYREVLQMNNQDPNSLGILVSLGTGESKTTRFAEGRWGWAQVYQFFKAAKKLASGSQTTHEFMDQHSRDRKFPYYRFNVRHGLHTIKLDEWKKSRRGRPSTLEHITAMTREYLEHGFVDEHRRISVQEHLDRAAEILVANRRSRAKTPRWELVLGVRYRCTIDSCHSGQLLCTSEGLQNHLVTHHGYHVLEECSDSEKQQIQDLIQNGRIEQP